MLHLERRRFSLSLVRDADIAHDVLQESLLQVARYLKALRDPAWVKAWAWRIATRAAIRRARRDARYDRMFPRFEEGNDQSAIAEAPDDTTLDPELARRLPGLIDRLPPASRIVIRMHYLDEMTYPEIAEALEIPRGTMKSRLAYGLTALRSLINEAANPTHAG